MRRKRVRRAYAALAVLVLVIATAVVAGYMTSGTSAQAVGAGEGDSQLRSGATSSNWRRHIPATKG